MYAPNCKYSNSSNKRPDAYCFRGPNLSLIFLKNPENNILVGSNDISDSIHTVVAKINVITVQLFINVL